MSSLDESRQQYLVMREQSKPSTAQCIVAASYVRTPNGEHAPRLLVTDQSYLAALGSDFSAKTSSVQSCSSLENTAAGTRFHSPLLAPRTPADPPFVEGGTVND